jgi:hypothetical protein
MLKTPAMQFRHVKVAYVMAKGTLPLLQLAD